MDVLVVAIVIYYIDFGGISNSNSNIIYYIDCGCISNSNSNSNLLIDV